MANCAVVRISDNVVENTIVAEVTDLPPNGCFLVEMTTEKCGQIGDIWNGVNFIRTIE